MSVKIRGYPSYKITQDGKVYSEKSKKFLTNSLSTHGYYKISLCKNEKQKTFKVHRLVAEHFIDNPENRKCVNHKNGKKTDNRVQNLEWCTFSENTYHAYRTGLRIPTKGNQYTNGKKWKIGDEELGFIKSNMGKLTQQQMAEQLNVHQTTIHLTLKKINRHGVGN